MRALYRQSCNWKSGPAWDGRRCLIRMKSKKSRATMALWWPKEDPSAKWKPLRNNGSVHAGMTAPFRFADGMLSGGQRRRSSKNKPSIVREREWRGFRFPLDRISRYIQVSCLHTFPLFILFLSFLYFSNALSLSLSFNFMHKLCKRIYSKTEYLVKYLWIFFFFFFFFFKVIYWRENFDR